MLYRLTTLGIIAFWMVMMGLLVRLETHPDATDILNVPVSYVARIMFKHGQQSLLTVREKDTPIGTVSFRPSTTGSDSRLLDFSGAISMQLPMSKTRQRFNFHGTMNMDVALRVLDYRLDFTLQEPRYRLSVQGNVARNTLGYQVHQGEQQTSAQTLPMKGTALGPALLQSMGIDPSALPISTGSIAPPDITARETQITLHGEQLQVYEVSFHEGTSPVADFYITQLGQVVTGKTNFGYTLSSEDYQ